MRKSSKVDHQLYQRLPLHLLGAPLRGGCIPTPHRVGSNRPHLSFCSEPFGLEQRTLGIASVPQGTKQFIAINGELEYSARQATAKQQQQRRLPQGRTARITTTNMFHRYLCHHNEILHQIDRLYHKTAEIAHSQCAITITKDWWTNCTYSSRKPGCHCAQWDLARHPKQTSACRSCHT